MPTSIDTYNTWIQDRVAAGHTDIQGYSSTFNVVGSTAAVDARDNTGTTYTSGSSYKGVPIYWLNGNKVVDDYEDFYDGGWDEEASMRTEAGTSIEAPGGVFTGSDHDGTEQFSSTNNSRALGAGLSQGFVEVWDAGLAGLRRRSPCWWTPQTGDTLVPFYGLSGVFRVVAGSNTPATGKPTISGTPQVNQTLTADISSIMDADGLPAAGQFSYQWISDDSDIDGATDSTYTLVFADYGNTIKVRVSFTDDNDYPESLTSTAVGWPPPTATSSTPPFSPWASAPFLAAIAATPTPEFLNLPTSPTTAIRQGCKSWRTAGMSFTFRLCRHWVRGIMPSSWTTRRYSLARPAEARCGTKSQTTA